MSPTTVPSRGPTNSTKARKAHTIITNIPRSTLQSEVYFDALLHHNDITILYAISVI